MFRSGSFVAAELHLPARGSLPLDRYLAPLCVGITTVLLASLLFLNLLASVLLVVL